MNPIKNARAILKRNLLQQSTYLTSKDSRFGRLSEVWDSLSTEYFQKLVDSISDKVVKLNKVKILSTKY